MMRRTLVILLAFASACTREQKSAAFRPLSVGQHVPAYAISSLAGDTVRVGDGTITLLNVWATWCESCREEMTDLASLGRRYAARGVRVVAVSVDAGSAERVRRFVQAEKLPFIVAHDPGATVQQAFQAVGVPETYLVGADGTLEWVRRGGLHGASDTVLAALDSAVQRATNRTK